MIQVERLTSASPKDVWRVLGDGWLYSGLGGGCVADA